jgi:hypothetical protein
MQTLLVVANESPSLNVFSPCFKRFWNALALLLLSLDYFLELGIRDNDKKQNLTYIIDKRVRNKMRRTSN